MAATCAACGRPIVKPQKILLIESEVVHKQCVGQPTIGQQQKQLVADLELEVARARRQLEQAQLRASNADALWRAETKARETVGALCVTATERADRATRELTAIRAELAAARQEIARQQRSAVPEESGSDQQPEDASAVRFGLLELDPL